MILNMSYGASQAQIVDFTLTSETTGANVDISIPNVKLPNGSVNGFMIYPTSNIVGNQNGCIYYAWWNPSIPLYEGKNIQTGVKYYLFDEYRLDEAIASFSYNPETEVFTTTINHLQYWLYPGNYRLVIW